MTEANEVPWFSDPPNARLATLGVGKGDVIAGWLHFIDPQGNKAAIPVTYGEQTELKTNDGPGTPIWHIEVQGNLATVSPSVHFVGHWHSPNPVQFILVDEL